MTDRSDRGGSFELDLGPQPDPARERVVEAGQADEMAIIQALIPLARLSPDQLAQTQRLATTLAESVRAERARAGGVDALMAEFSLDSEEGVALMCLAEALLRIPDLATRDRLIRDKVSRGDWRAHLGASPSLFVNAAAWGLLVTGRIVDMHSEGALDRALASLLRKGGEPLVRRGVDLAMRLLGKQFVAGRTIDEALAGAREREARGYTFSFDMLGEAAITSRDAARYFEAYQNAIRAIGTAADGRGVLAAPGISVKLSALHPRYSRAQRKRVLAELAPKLRDLSLLASGYDIGLNIDAEEAERLELSLDLIEELAGDPSLESWRGLGVVVQAYQKRSLALVEWAIELARRHRRRLMLRLVKGAYWDSEIKRAQVQGLATYPVFTRKVHTDVAYLACAKAMLAAPDAIYPQFASHNAFTIAAIHALAGNAEYEFQCLHGMGESIYDQVVGANKLDRSCRVYAPVGSHETLLGYLVRRLLENGANTSFVNRIVDPAVSIAELVADPVAEVERVGGMPHPRIPVPAQMLPGRINSRGIDLAADGELRPLARELATKADTQFACVPLIADRAVRTHAAIEGIATEIRNPADHDDRVGTVVEATVDDVTRAVTLALEQGSAWSNRAPDERAACLERTAALFDAQRETFVALAIREAGKTLAGAIAEVREAVDFCRYYAMQAREPEFSKARAVGPIVAISPWNFPLAIFAGQISAALAAGNPVLAKPAEETPLIAHEAVQTFHRAGVPPGALQLLPGGGDDIGAALVADTRIAGVIFTGSTDVARLIDRELAKRDDDPVLIAETGGQNAMIVDSSALAEQVVADALISAFDSAGQRCSALRLLCVQRDVADSMLSMLKDALLELRVGDPRLLSTDVGPVITAGARDALTAYIERMRPLGFPVFQAPLPPECARGTFVAPTVIDLGDIAGIGALTGEVFGPVLHFVRWHRDDLPSVIDAINATGYALTHGIHTRIDETVASILARVRAGNVYVNRNIIGAVVGVQPFGGHGLSGTGPKAGGPLYLRRLVLDAVPLRFPNTGANDQLPARRIEGAEPDFPTPASAFGPADANDSVAAQRIQRPDANDRLPLHRIELPGPTGESNSLEFHPRGVVACIADTERALVAQARAVLAAGSTVLMLRGHLTLHARDRLLPAKVILADALDPGAVDLVLLDARHPLSRRVRTQLAASPGKIVPVVVPNADGSYDWARLVIERTVTVNTAAAGGNAPLLSLAADAIS